MKYGTFTNGNLIPAPRRIILDGWQIFNPTDEQLTAAGYKPVVYTDSPEAPEGYYAEAYWTETEEAITQEWRLVEAEPEPLPTPAWDISQGEYIPEGFLLTRDGVTYECLVGHYAAWNKQPPNDEYWRTIG
jgi:hypothetical protein